MSVRSGQSITKTFTTRVFATGVATDADSTPTGTLYVNGTADAATVNITNITTGFYKAAVTLPTLAVGDVVDLRINATVSSVTDNAVIWTDTKDIDIGATGKTPATIAAGDIATDAIDAASLKTDAITEIQNGLSTLTQTQVTGGAYALNSASFAFNAALDFTTTQKAATLARVTLVDTTTTNTDMRGTDGAYTGTPPTASAISTQVNADITTAHGSGSYQTATGFSTHSAADVWAVATRTLSGTLGSFDALWNKIKAWLGALAGKTADTVTRAEINATTAGATYNETTDSLQAIAGTGGGGGGTTIVVTSSTSNITDRVQATTITLYYGENGYTIGPNAVLNDGEPVDLTAFTSLRFTIEDKNGTDLLVVTNVTISGADDNYWQITGTSAATAIAPAMHAWSLRGIGTNLNTVLAKGTVSVIYAPDQDAV